ncbi:hypothetical protein AB46_3106 [Escherichia coli 3-267-03_S1_C2]|uniref:Uncharacterized protein n=1 Tax=Escherichia coli 1-250-04_S3_C1 TaxID=1444135 RepID=A0AAN4NQ61_ECOLX|nr:hypothetical protein AC00_4023 [Escherichia coli 1-250-04_S3_C1]KDU03022.1 hypothetical protein AB46_3106 [Escherichia coli 3-267-03_S1_C2]
MAICAYFCLIAVCYFGLWSRNFIFNCMRTNHQYKEILKIVLNSALDM